MCLLAKASVYKECLTSVNKTLVRQVGKVLKQIKQLFMEGESPDFTENVQSGRENSAHYKAVSPIKCPLCRSSLKGNILGINLLLRKIFAIQRCPLCKMSAIERFHCICLLAGGSSPSSKMCNFQSYFL